MYSPKVMEHFSSPHNVGEIKDADGIGKVGNPVCLAQGTMVQLNSHIQEIEDVAISERILTHEGVYSKVIQKSVRPYNGKIVRLKNHLGCEHMTPDHLVYAMKRPEGDKYLRNKGKRTLSPDWYHAEEIEPRDIALYPILREIIDERFFPLSAQLDERRSKKPLADYVSIDADLLRLMGFYLTEGSTSLPYSIYFSFNSKEKEYCEFVERTIESKFGLRSRIENRSNGTVSCVIVNSTDLAGVMERSFGDGAANKKIPDLLMHLPIEKQASLLEGLWRGDGYINIERNGPRAGFATISHQLAGQVKTLLLRQGIIPSIYSEPGCVLENISHQPSYRIHVGDRDSLTKLCRLIGVEYSPTTICRIHSWIERGYLYTPVTEKDIIDYSGVVYNFEVEGQHSFATESFIYHNCGDLMYIYIKVKDDRLTDIKFKTFGCGAAIATSSMVTDLAMGKTIEEALKITRKDVANELGGLPPQKMHCSNLAADALHAAIHDYLVKQGMEAPSHEEPKHEDEGRECLTSSDVIVPR